MTKLAIDFNDAYLLNPPLWDRCIQEALARGLEVRFVTNRHHDKGNNSDIEMAVDRLGIAVIYCGARQKKEVCRELGWVPDHWITGAPEKIPELHHLETLLNFGLFVDET